MQRITSSDNPKFKDAMKLHSARGRKKQNRIIVFGRREIERALLSNIKPQQIFVAEESAAAGFDQGIVFQLPSELFEKINFGSRPDNVVMTADRPSTDLGEVIFAKRVLVTVVEAIEKPGNLGGILRSADASGSAVIVANPMTDIFHPNSIRNSSGAAFGALTATGSNEEVMARLRTDGFRILVANPAATSDFHQVDLTGRTAVVLGNEANGVSQFWMDNADESFKLPMLGVADSLNVSVTAAIVMYESLRQRS